MSPSVEQMKKGTCGCGRSPTGNCIGWHALSESALEDLERLSSYFNERGLIEDLAQTRNTLALVYSKSGDEKMAKLHVESSLDLLIKTPSLSRAKLGIWNAEVILALGERDRAISILQNSIQALSGTQASRATATAWAEMAAIFDLMGESERALVCLRSSVQAAGLIQAKDTVKLLHD